MAETPHRPSGGESAAPPHPTSLAVWAVPSPVVVNSRFTVTVGVKCAAGCPLAGQRVAVRDEAGAGVGEGRLGETPAPGTRALYAAEVTLHAPAGEGVHSWSAAFAAPVESETPVTVESESPAATRPESSAAVLSQPPTRSATPHAAARATFGFRTARPPEHRVTVTVLDRETEAPLRNVEVQLGVYRASTGEDGQARIEAPAGRYDLYVRKAGCAPHAGSVAVHGDVTVRVAAAPAPEADPDDDQVWM